MKKACFLALAVGFAMMLLLACVAVWAPASAQEKPAAAIPKWEYKIVNKLVVMLRDEEADFNKLGDEGWELAAVSTRNNNGPAVSFVFKRPKR